MPCGSASISATSASGFKGSAVAAPGSPVLGLISVTFGARLLSSSLALREPGGSPAAARQLGPTTGFGGSCVRGAAALAAGTLSGGAGGDDAAALGAIVGGVVGADIVGPGVGASGDGAAAGAAVGLIAGGAIAPRSLTSRGGASRLGAPVAINDTDILPNVKPNVMPANSMAAAANVRSRSISGSPCI
jgi:hypothetical protein